MAHDVFISYAVEDKEVAGKVCEALEAQAIRCWMAPRDIPYGADYEEAIVDAIASSPLLVLILSAHSNASPHVKREIQNACAEGSPTEIIPLRIEAVPYSKALRYYLGSAQWLDASTPPLESHLQRLAEHVRARLKRGGEQPPRPSPPPVVSVPDDGASHRAADDRRTFAETGDGRKPLPAAWVAAGAGALVLLAIIVVSAYWLSNRKEGRDGANDSAGNDNVVNLRPSSPTPTPTPTPNINSQKVTPTPKAPPTQTPTPVRPVIPIPIFPDDDRIKADVEKALAGYPEFSEIKVAFVRRGSVMLRGVIVTKDDKQFSALEEKAGAVAKSVKGVKEVSMAVKQKVP